MRSFNPEPLPGERHPLGRSCAAALPLALLMLPYALVRYVADHRALHGADAAHPSMADHVTWLSEQARAGRRADTDELWTMLFFRLGENKSLTNQVWRAWVSRPEPSGDDA